MEVRFFGCGRGPGHYLVDHNGYSEYTKPVKCPWRESQIDGRLQPGCKEGESSHERDRRKEIEGLARIHYKGGWTALCFWDRSVDGRSGSNGNFFAEGTHDFGAMLAIAQDRFPHICQRFKFAIVLEVEEAKAKV